MNPIPGAVTTLPIVLVVNPIIEFISLSTLLIMPRFRKSKTQATDPPSPAELARKLISKRESRALAASSTAIALSIGSAFHDTGEASSDAAIVRERNTGWQAAYGAARMAVEIAKESSDLCPPLKAVVGAMSVLIRNYDVSESCSQPEYLLILCLFSIPAIVR